jgi:hypothetical protein
MSTSSKVEDSTPAPACTPSWDTNDLHQQEVSRILKSFQYDIMGIISLGKDGIMRSLTADRKVLSAEAFSTVTSINSFKQDMLIVKQHANR